MWVRAAVVALAGFGGLVMAPSLSLAQYPGSAGDLNTGTQIASRIWCSSGSLLGKYAEIKEFDARIILC